MALGPDCFSFTPVFCCFSTFTGLTGVRLFRITLTRTPVVSINIAKVPKQQNTWENLKGQVLFSILNIWPIFYMHQNSKRSCIQWSLHHLSCVHVNLNWCACKNLCQIWMQLKLWFASFSSFSAKFNNNMYGNFVRFQKKISVMRKDQDCCHFWGGLLLKGKQWIALWKRQMLVCWTVTLT